MPERLERLFPRLSFRIGWLTKGSSFLEILGSYGLQKVERQLPPQHFTLGWLRQGLLRWNGIFLSKFCPQVALKKERGTFKGTSLRLSSGFTYFGFLWVWFLVFRLLLGCLPQILLSGGSQHLCCIGMCPSSSKCQPGVARKRSATLEWHHLKFTLAWLTKCLKRWNGSFFL